MRFSDFSNESDFNDTTAPSENTLIPEGFYNATLAKLDVRTTQSGTGKYFSCDFVICDNPEFNGRHVFASINYINANPQAQDIGRRQIDVLRRATGKTRVFDTDEFLGVKVNLKIGISPANEKYREGNTVKDIKLVQSDFAPSVNPSMAQTSAPQADAPKPSTAPWAR